MTTNRTALALATLAYAATVVLANVLTSRLGLVPVGFGLVATAGTYAAGLALLARDVVHKLGGPWYALAAVVVGIALSYVFADPFVATASAAAFAAAELIDLAVFHPLRRHGFGRAALASNLVSAPVDTFVFLWVAGFPIVAASVGGQLVGKLVWTTVVPLVAYAAGLAVLRWQERRRQPETLWDAIHRDLLG